MISSRSSNSFLISAGAHAVFLFFMANVASKAPQIGLQPFKPSEVSVVDEAEKKRIREWLQQQRMRQSIAPEPAQKDISAEVNAKLMEMFKLKKDDIAKSRPFKDLPEDTFNLSEQIGRIAPVIPDNMPAIKDRIIDSADIAGGRLFAKVDASDKHEGGGLEDKPAPIKIEFAVSDTAQAMQLKDDPVFIAKNFDPGSKDLPFGVDGDIKVSSPAAVGASDESEFVHRGDSMQARIIGVLKSRGIVSYVLPEISRASDVKVDRLRVGVKVTVLGNGDVKNNIVVEQTSGHDYIDNAVKGAVLKWKFEALPMSMSWQEQIGVIEIEIKFI